MSAVILLANVATSIGVNFEPLYHVVITDYTFCLNHILATSCQTHHHTIQSILISYSA